jgi:hypothetical protein
MNTLYLIVSLFSVGGLFGMYLITLVLEKKTTPKYVIMIHAVFVIIALCLLIYYSAVNAPGLIECVVLFVMAAIAGFAMVMHDKTGEKFPRWLAVTHALFAISGFVVLLLYAFNQ